ncbi:glycosyltransferase family 39 protein [Rhizobium sp. BR 317]|uniref:glycosyltransferase family 39 protein n=1 Tax=Rhizobium sp. BR 317 TaxID=3040015 RepID=UPI0039BEDF1D
MTKGALAAPPIYDDVGYLWDAYRRIAFANVGSLFALIKNFVADPPHAPIQTFTAIIGFSVFGPNNYGPYIANIWALAACAGFVFIVARSQLAAKPSLCLTTIVMFIPVTGALVNDFRPDMAAALVFAFAGYLLISQPISTFRIRYRILLGIFIAFAVFMKPTAVVVTVPMIGLAGILSIVSDGRARIRNELPPVVFVATAALIALAPLAYVWGKHTFEYVYAALITDKDIWNTQGGWYDYLIFNATGAAGTIALGVFFKIGFAAIGLDVIVSLHRGGLRSLDRSLAFYFWCLVIFLGVAMATGKSLQQSSFFFFPFIFASILAVSRLLRQTEPTLAAVFLALTVVFVPPANSYQDSQKRLETMQMLPQITNLIAAKAKSVPACNGAMHGYGVIGAYPLTGEAVALDVAQKFRTQIAIYQLFILRDFDDLMRHVDASNFVLAPNQAGLQESLAQRLPGTAFYRQIIDKLRADPKWSEHRIDAADPATLFVREKC